MICKAFGRFAGDDGARAAAVEREAGDELGPIDAGLCEEGQHFGRGPAIEGRRLHRDQHQVGGEERGAHEAGDTRRSVDDDVIDIAGDLRCLAVQCVPCEADGAEQSRQALACALL